MRIRTAIFGVYAGALIVGGTVIMTFTLSEVRPRYVESMRRSLADTASLVARLSQEDFPVNGNPSESWTERLQGLQQTAGALRVYVTTTAGKVLFDSRNSQAVGLSYAYQPEMKRFFEPPLGGEPPVVVDGELRVTAPVFYGAFAVGYVGVARQLDGVGDAVGRARERLAIMGSLVGIVMLGSGWWISNRVTRSLLRLGDYARAVRDGRAAKPPHSRATEIRELGAAFEEMRTSLEGKAYVERYTQSLAHALKAPLAGVRGAAELLDEDMPPEQRTRFLGHVRDEVNRVQQIVERMLQLAALEARSGPRELVEVPLPQVMKEVASAHQAVLHARGVHVELESTIGLSVKGEPFLIAQALNALLENALDFAPDNSVITIRAELAGSWARLAVEDQGPGVPEFARERVFERFYSLPRPGTRRKSTGLGLSFVREIAERHGGRARMENRPEGGARAVIDLPAMKS